MALYDPNEFPEAEVKSDFTLADVLAWARTKPADETYDYGDTKNCAICQFLRDRGIPFYSAGGDYWRRPDRSEVPFPDGLDLSLARLPSTFGGLAKRLEALV